MSRLTFIFTALFLASGLVSEVRGLAGQGRQRDQDRQQPRAPPDETAGTVAALDRELAAVDRELDDQMVAAQKETLTESKPGKFEQKRSELLRKYEEKRAGVTQNSRRKIRTARTKRRAVAAGRVVRSRPSAFSIRHPASSIPPSTLNRPTLCIKFSPPFTHATLRASVPPSAPLRRPRMPAPAPAPNFPAGPSRALRCAPLPSGAPCPKS